MKTIVALNQTDLKRMHADMRDPSGFANNDDPIVTFDDPTRTLTIAPDVDNYAYYCKGQYYLITGSRDYQIPDTSGLYYIYYNGNDAITSAFNPSAQQQSEIIYTYALIAIVYWSTGKAKAIYFTGKYEMHGIQMDGVTHGYLHFTQGTKYLEAGALTDILADEAVPTDANAQFGVDGGAIQDEDITVITNAVDKLVGLPVFYKIGTGEWSSDDNAGFSVLTAGTGRIAYNALSGTWSVTECTSGWYTFAHTFMTNNDPKQIIAVMAQSQHATAAGARAAAKTAINELVTDSLPFAEFVAQSTVIFQTKDSYTGSAVKGRIITTEDGEDYEDWRESGLNPAVGGASDHLNLSNLNAIGALSDGARDGGHIYLVSLDGRTGGQTIDGDLSLSASSSFSIGNATLTSGRLAWVGAPSPEIATDGYLIMNADRFVWNTTELNHLAVSDSSPGSVTPIVRFRHYGAGTVIDGVGASFYLNTNNDNAQQLDHVRFEGVMTDVSDGVESSKLDLKVYENGSLITPLTVAALTQINATIGVAITSPLNLMTVNNIANENNFIVDNTSVGTIDNIQTIAKYSYTSATGIIDHGIGARAIFNAPNSDNAQIDIVKLESSMPSVTDSAEDSMLEVKTYKAGVEVSGVGILGKDTIAGRGDIEGFAIKYNSTTGVTVTVGKCEANEKYFVLDTDEVHPMTSLAVAFDRHYIYIDDSASTTGGIPVFIDSTTAPAWSDAKQGFYNGDDRNIGFVVSDAGSAIVAYFTAMDLGGKVVQNTNENALMSLATSMNPDGTWQTPDETESSAVLPISAISIFIRIQNTDAGASVRLYATAKESADAGTTLDPAETRWTFFGTGSAVSPVTLGASRNIRIGGTDTNDNALSCSITSYKYKR